MFDFVGNILKFYIFTIIDFNFFSLVKKRLRPHACRTPVKAGTNEIGRIGADGFDWHILRIVKHLRFTPVKY